MTLTDLLWWRGIRKRSIGVQVWIGSNKDLTDMRPHVAWLYDLGYTAFGYHQEYDTLTLYFKRRTSWPAAEAITKIQSKRSRRSASNDREDLRATIVANRRSIGPGVLLLLIAGLCPQRQFRGSWVGAMIDKRLDTSED